MMPVVWHCRNNYNSKFSSWPYWHTNLKVCPCNASQSRVLRVQQREQMVRGRGKRNWMLWIWQKNPGKCNMVWHFPVLIRTNFHKLMESWQICKSSLIAWRDIRTGDAVIAHRVAYGVVSDLWMGDVAFITERHNCGNSAIFSAGHQEDLFQGLEKQKRKKSLLGLSFPWAEK